MYLSKKDAAGSGGSLLIGKKSLHGKRIILIWWGKQTLFAEPAAVLWITTHYYIYDAAPGFWTTRKKILILSKKLLQCGIICFYPRVLHSAKQWKPLTGGCSRSQGTMKHREIWWFRSGVRMKAVFRCTSGCPICERSGTVSRPRQLTP